MPVSQHPVELLDWLARQQLLTPLQAGELRPLLPTFPDIRLLAKELIRRGWLSPFAVNQILTHRGDQLVLGCYRLQERLGEGAMGQVFKAWNTKLQSVVAVKTIHKDLIANARAMERFRQEIEAAAQLDHPNIVKVRDADEIDSRPFMVMDFIEGVNVSYRVKTEGPLPIPEAAECIRQAAHGLQHAFERGVVHRDIKPANLLLEPVMADTGTANAGAANRQLESTVPFCVKILDFGLARFDSERRYSTRLTQPGSTLGTVDYMAPEQAESARDADTRSDIYALGCTLFFALTGKPAFPGTSVAEKIGARLTGKPPSVRTERPDVPIELDAILRRMMARQPADRYQTPAEVAEALAPFTMPPHPTPATPRMEIDDRIPLAAPVAPAVAHPLTVAHALTDAVPLAMPIAPTDPLDAPFAPPQQPDEGLPFMPPPADPANLETKSPFSLSAGDLDVPAGAAAMSAPTLPGAAPPARPGPGRMDRRHVVALAAGGAALFFLLVGCGGWLLVSWSGAKPSTDTWPAGAEVQLTEAFLSTMDDTIQIGKRANVIVKIRRVKFDGPVDVRVEGLPSGVTTTDKKVTLKSGAIAIEVPVIASFGIDPADTEIRVIATSRNLIAQKTIPLRLIKK